MDIEKIAEGLGGMSVDVDGKYWTGDTWKSKRFFDPENNWQDTGLVLEALLKKLAHEEGRGIELFDDYFQNEYHIYSPNKIKSETLQQAICKAYLSTLDE